MKKRLLQISSVVAAIFISASAMAQTAGTLTFSFTTTSHSGYQGTKNALAIWIQTGTGSFVKTYFRYAGAGGGTQDHLPTYAVNSGGTSSNCLSTSCNKVGATTGATLPGATTKTFTWDGKDANGNLVADGTYKITIEQTWNHGTSGTVVKSYSFTKGPSPVVQNPTADANFTGVSLSWQPTSFAGIDENIISSDVKIHPNPSSNGIFTVEFLKAEKVEVMNISGEIILSEEVKIGEVSKLINLSAFENGVYFICVKNANELSKQKVVLEK